MNKVMKDIKEQLDKPRKYVVKKEDLCKPIPKYDKRVGCLLNRKTLPSELSKNIISDLKNTNLTNSDIAAKNGCSESYVNMINIFLKSENE